MNQQVNGMKVFGIGLNKTGTTTLGECGKVLGYRVKSCDRVLLEDVILRRDFIPIKEVICEYDLFEDWPWPLVFRELDQLFPGSKFILTTRLEEESWLSSLKLHSMKTRPKGHCRKLAYGYNYPNRHEQAHLEFYRRHNSNVRAYFKGRDKDFLEVCWERGHEWTELCDFLGKDIPVIPFPHENKGSDQQSGWVRFWTNRILSAVGV
jgi:hypothetical protein